MQLRVWGFWGLGVDMSICLGCRFAAGNPFLWAPHASRVRFVRRLCARIRCAWKLNQSTLGLGRFRVWGLGLGSTIPSLNSMSFKPYVSSLKNWELGTQNLLVRKYSTLTTSVRLPFCLSACLRACMIASLPYPSYRFCLAYLLRYLLHNVI